MKLFFKVAALAAVIFLASIPFWHTENRYKKAEIQAPKPIEPVVVKAELPDMADIPKFQEIRDVRTKKQAFVDYLQPIFENENKRIIKTREQLQQIQTTLTESGGLSAQQQNLLKKWAKAYKEDPNQSSAGLIEALLLKIDVIPVDLALMQAANESGWGTSRFARKGYNFFGLWCYRQGCGFVPGARNTGAKHEVAKFDSIEHAVSRYMRNINGLFAYDELRNIRQFYRQKNMPLDSEMLATGLTRYSQRGPEYVKELIQMMRVNRKYIRKV